MDIEYIASSASATTNAALRQLADSATMIVWMTDAGNVCIYLNQTASALFPKWEDFEITAWSQFIYPEDRARTEPIVRAAKDRRQEYQVEYRILKSDGSLRWLMSSAAPRFSREAEFLGYSGTILDVADRHAAFEKLAKSEREYRLLAENCSDLISHHAAGSGNYLYASPSFENILGWEPSALAGNSVYDYIHPDDAPLIHAEVLKQLETGSGSELIEFRSRHKDGRYIWLASKIQILKDPGTGIRTGSVAVSRDITLEREAREEIKKREERFRSLTNLSSDWFWETDENDRFTFVSDGLERLFGSPADQVIGKSRGERTANPADPGPMEYFARVARREPYKNIPYSAYATLKGEIRHSLLSGEPVFDNGLFKGYRGVGRDVTDETEIAKKLAQLAEENKALIENSLDMMVMLDHDGRCLRVNAAVKDVLGYAPEELVGKQYAALVVPEDQEQAAVIFDALRNGKNIVRDFESRWVRKDGGLVFLSCSIRWSADSSVMYATAHDITARSNIQAELDKSKDELINVLESIGDAFYALDRNWRATYVNQKTAAFLGIPKEKLLGKTPWEVVPDFETSTIFSHYQKAMETGRNILFENYFKPVGAWVEVRLYPHADGLSVFFHDITGRRKAEDAIRAGEMRLKKIIGMTPAGYVLTDAQGIMVEVNPAMCGITGYPENELIGRNILALTPQCPLDGALLVKGGATTVRGKETVIERKDGSLVYALINVNIERDSDGNALSLTAFVTDITERKKTESRMEQLATHDSLTGLPNRALINTRLNQMMGVAHKDESIAVMFIDLDRFKEVNDSMGHAPGDILLCEVAARLQKVMRPDDIVARLGGDEFIAAACCSHGPESAMSIAEKLLNALAAPFDIEGQEVVVSASIGISMFPQDGRTNELLFQNADTAMYRAKIAGRNCYRFFEAEMSVTAKARMTIEQALRRALERNEFELHYQPRINLASMSIVGMEALIRWNHPQLGAIPPLEFIPIAEERGLIEAIGRWVLQEACKQTRRFIDRFGRPLRVSVNLSARQLQCRDLLEQVEAALNDAKLPPRLLELELTESALIGDIDVSSRVLGELKQLGIFLAVDDFGTGYSALAYLQRFPLDVLKLDRSFINAQIDSGKNSKFIKAFINLAHALNLSVVAEGIETAETLQFLRALNCDEGQGYLFAKPLPIDEFEKYLSRLPAPELKSKAG
jgi:diguanylate cyclase (GGDEF)-like protein/PAS domain S-box-containing protein